MSTTDSNYAAADTTTARSAPLLISSNSERLLLGRESSRETIMSQKEALRTWIIILELIWSSMIMSATSVVVDMSKGETTELPLKVWIVGYGVLRVVYSIGVCLDYWHWREVSGATMFASLGIDNTRRSVVGRVAKCVQSINSVLNLIWWILGLYWIFSGGKILADDAPKQFWYTAIFLAIDLLIVLISVFTPYIFYGASWCRLPLDQTTSSSPKLHIQESPNGVMNERDTADTPTKHATSGEDAV